MAHSIDILRTHFGDLPTSGQITGLFSDLSQTEPLLQAYREFYAGPGQASSAQDGAITPYLDFCNYHSITSDDPAGDFSEYNAVLNNSGYVPNIKKILLFSDAIRLRDPVPYFLERLSKAARLEHWRSILAEMGTAFDQLKVLAPAIDAGLIQLCYDRRKPVLHIDFDQDLNEVFTTLTIGPNDLRWTMEKIAMIAVLNPRHFPSGRLSFFDDYPRHLTGLYAFGDDTVSMLSIIYAHLYSSYTQLEDSEPFAQPFFDRKDYLLCFTDMARIVNQYDYARMPGYSAFGVDPAKLIDLEDLRRDPADLKNEVRYLSDAHRRNAAFHTVHGTSVIDPAKIEIQDLISMRRNDDVFHDFRQLLVTSLQDLEAMKTVAPREDFLASVRDHKRALKDAAEKSKRGSTAELFSSAAKLFFGSIPDVVFDLVRLALKETTTEHPRRTAQRATLNICSAIVER